MYKFKLGDIVRIVKKSTNNKDEHGQYFTWTPDMTKLIGKSGIVAEISTTGYTTLLVRIPNCHGWYYLPESLELELDQNAINQVTAFYEAEKVLSEDIEF